MKLEDAIVDIRSLVADRRAIILVGAGVSMLATQNDPRASWSGLLEAGLDEIQSYRREEHNDIWRRQLEELLRSSSLDDMFRAADQIQSEISANGGNPSRYRNWLRKTVGSLHTTDPGILEALNELQVPIISTNYDSLLDDHLGDATETTWNDPERANRILRGELSGVLHLHGHWRQPETVILTRADYRKKDAEKFVKRLQEAAALMGTLVFVGVGSGSRDPDLLPFINALADQGGNATYPHYRLCISSEYSALQREHHYHNIEVVDVGADYTDLIALLTQVRPIAHSRGDSDSKPPGTRELTIEDLSQNLLKSFASRVMKTKQLEVVKNSHLITLGLTDQNGVVSGSAGLCFASNPSTFYPGARTTLSMNLSGRQQTLGFEGPLRDQVEATVQRIVNSISVLGESDRLRVLWTTAIREMLSNAIVHRTYESGDPTLVKVTESEVRVVNPGRLARIPPKENPLDALSHAKYPHRARYLHYLGAAEGTGLGFKTLLDLQDHLKTLGEGGEVSVGEDGDSVVARILLPSTPPFRFSDEPTSPPAVPVMARPASDGEESAPHGMEKGPAPAREAETGETKANPRDSAEDSNSAPSSETDGPSPDGVPSNLDGTGPAQALSRPPVQQDPDAQEAGSGGVADRVAYIKTQNGIQWDTHLQAASNLTTADPSDMELLFEAVQPDQGRAAGNWSRKEGHSGRKSLRDILARFVDSKGRLLFETSPQNPDELLSWLICAAAAGGHDLLLVDDATMSCDESLEYILRGVEANRIVVALTQDFVRLSRLLIDVQSPVIYVVNQIDLSRMRSGVECWGHPRVSENYIRRRLRRLALTDLAEDTLLEKAVLTNIQTPADVGAINKRVQSLGQGSNRSSYLEVLKQRIDISDETMISLWASIQWAAGRPGSYTEFFTQAFLERWRSRRNRVVKWYNVLSCGALGAGWILIGRHLGILQDGIWWLGLQWLSTAFLIGVASSFLIARRERDFLEFGIRLLPSTAGFIVYLLLLIRLPNVTLGQAWLPMALLVALTVALNRLEGWLLNIECVRMRNGNVSASRHSPRLGFLARQAVKCNLMQEVFAEAKTDGYGQLGFPRAELPSVSVATAIKAMAENAAK
jgi:hypothetical protein